MAKIPRVAVLGAGPAGLVAAHLAAREGWPTALFESHSKPGGCASYFRRETSVGMAYFDAGATVLNGFESGGWLTRFAEACSLPVEDYAPLTELLFKLPARDAFSLNASSTAAWISSLCGAFPADRPVLERYLPRKLRQAERLRSALRKVPHLPVQTVFDIRRDLRLLFDFLPLAPAFLGGFARDFGAELRAEGLSNDFIRFVEMNALITLQTNIDDVHPLYGAMALFFYPLGSGAIKGGMKGLFESWLAALGTRANVRISMRTPVTALHPTGDGCLWVEVADGRRQGPFDLVFSSLPRWNTQQLLYPSAQTAVRPSEETSDLWSALVGYFVVADQSEFPAGTFHAHTGGTRASDFDAGDTYFSFSARNNERRAPSGYRTVTASTHAATAPWQNLSRFGSDYAAQKAKATSVLEARLREVFPQLEVVFAEFGTPLTFARYTRRMRGAVGGLPLSYAHTFFRSPGQRTPLQGLYQIGDTSFPGQSIYACAIGAAAALEKAGARPV